MRNIGPTCVILLLALVCNTACGFKPICDCADMNGQWTTERQLFENGELTNHSEGINMSIQMNECGAQGTLGIGGKISNAYFAGGVANNLVGKWSLGGEEGTFNIQLQNNEKDCASFAGKMYSGWNYSGKSWLFTGHKEKMDCDWYCKERDLHLHWDEKSENLCSCVCDSGYELDASGKNCVAVQTPNAKQPNNAPSSPSGSTTTSSSAGSVEIEITRSRGVTTLKAGEHTVFEMGKGEDAVINAICEKALYKIGLIQLVYEDTKFADWPAIVQYNLVNYVSILSVFCQEEQPSNSFSFDVASSNSTGGSYAAMKLELLQGPIRAKVVNNQVALDISTPNVIVSSQGKNTFGVAYDPTGKKSYLAAYQYPVQIQPSDGNQAPFILEYGQVVEVSNGQVALVSPAGQTAGEEIGQNKSPGSVPVASEGGCYADPITGQIVCVDSYGKPKGSNEGMHGGCYRDPYTGQYICVDSYGEPSDQQGTQVGGTQGQGSQTEGEQGLCFEDPETGEIICSDSGGEASNAEGGMQGGCYRDPVTGQYVCVD